MMSSYSDRKGSSSLFKGNLTENDWKHMWDINDLKFHQMTVYPDLVKYESIFFKNHSKVFLPLCGKSLDMIYLADKGYDVYGCELVEKAVKSFFLENSISYKKNCLENTDIISYKGNEKKITIYHGNILLLSSQLIGKFEAIWDRAALVAINILQRPNYANVLQDVMASDCKYLLNTFVLSGKEYEGPPHTVTEEDIEKLFGNFCNIKHLETKSANPSDFYITKADSFCITNSLLSPKV